MSTTLSIDLNSVDLYLGMSKPNILLYRKLTTNDVRKVLSNLGYEIDWVFTNDKPPVFNYQDVEDLIWNTTMTVPTASRVTVKEINKTNLVMITFEF